MIDESVDFCSLRFLTGEEANDRTQSALVPGGIRVEFWKDCGGNDAEPAFEFENRFLFPEIQSFPAPQLDKSCKVRNRNPARFYTCILRT